MPETATRTDIERAPAASHFVAFFEELGRAFVERQDLLHQIALALLAREHVLMTGPPGTAKSGIAAAVLGRIHDERTGAPSLFARQFTESTVQTDLVGPIDFKTLMQTGRTEHFTDEGMLGAVHAFLDEVLDGRDMLLRTTLNLLHERELKQGTSVTAGHIECALMTTNRYLAEVLEGSRETLLAFVDRIAFVSFVPKGFSEKGSFERVVRAQVGGAKRPRLEAVLTIQDLDVLQAMVDRVYVPDEVCDAMVSLIEAFDADLAGATRADPSFVPTRYLSTRTAVRLGRVLRAAVIQRLVTEGGAEEATIEDLASLRYALVLCGPPRASVDALLARETDPRERRQLSILRTERDLFDRALARVAKAGLRARPRKAVDVRALQHEVARLKEDPQPASVLATAKVLAVAADSGERGAHEAAALLTQTLASLGQRALEVGLLGGAGAEAAGDVIHQLSDLAAGLEQASGTTRPVARWLRGRALALLEEHASLGFERVGSVGAWLDAPPPETADVAQTSRRSDAMLAVVERVFAEHARLRAEGAEEPERPVEAPSPMARAVARLSDELVMQWDAALRRSVHVAFEAPAEDRLGAVLHALEPHLEHLEGVARRLEALGSEAGTFKARVLGPRLRPLLAAAFEQLDSEDRLALVERASALFERLEAVGLRHVLSAEELLTLTTRALLRTERAAGESPPPTFEGYRAMRSAEQRVTLTYTLLATAFRVGRREAVGGAAHDDRLAELHALLQGVPTSLLEEVAAKDAARVERAVEQLERFWGELGPVLERAGTSEDARAAADGLEQAKGSRFFHVTRDEGALARFSLEARLLAETFPSATERAEGLRRRIDALEARSSEVLAGLRRGYADAQWVDVLGRAGR